MTAKLLSPRERQLRVLLCALLDRHKDSVNYAFPGHRMGS
jgi:hypothetical protein